MPHDQTPTRSDLKREKLRAVANEHDGRTDVVPGYVMRVQVIGGKLITKIRRIS